MAKAARSKELLSEAASLMGRKGGPKGGEAVQAARTPAERSEAGRKVASAESLALCSFGCGGGERSFRSRSAGVLCPICRSRRRYRQSDSGELLGSPSESRWEELT